MYECFECNNRYEEEQKAINCCNESEIDDDGDIRISRKKFMKPGGKQHRCPNVNHGNKTWLVWLGVDEECPMCDYVYRPR